MVTAAFRHAASHFGAQILHRAGVAWMATAAFRHAASRVGGAEPCSVFPSSLAADGVSECSARSELLPWGAACAEQRRGAMSLGEWAPPPQMQAGAFRPSGRDAPARGANAASEVQSQALFSRRCWPQMADRNGVAWRATAAASQCSVGGAEPCSVFPSPLAADGGSECSTRSELLPWGAACAEQRHGAMSL